MIEVFTKNDCIQCSMTKNWLKKKEIDFVETNVDEDFSALAYLIEHNLRTLPVVFDKEGELLTLGFQPQNLQKLLK